MPPSDNKLLHATMIPWVIALVVFVGLGALLPGHRVSKREENQHDSGISALSDDVQLRGRSADPVIHLEPNPSEEIKTAPSFSRIPRVEVRSTSSVIDRIDETVRGRAPPLLAHS